MRLNPKNRFKVTYVISADIKKAKETAKDICYEQTVEVTKNLVDEKWMKDELIGRIESCKPLSKNNIQFNISYAGEITAFNLSGFLNVLFGNISLKNNIRIIGVDFGKDFISHFKGPKFGVKGIRNILNVHKRPLLGAVLKPMGKPVEKLAEMVYKFALGGIDIIKDDHGIHNQKFCPFRERVVQCIKAVNKAEDKTKKRTLYLPNITGEPDYMIKNAIWAKKQGAAGFLYAPALGGYDFIKKLSDVSGLPIMIHPALTGVFFSGSSHGINHEVLLGTIMRLGGGDFSIYPNFNGRFNFSKQTCVSINNALLEKLGNLKPAWPVPAGGFDAESIPELMKLFGNDVVFLIGSKIYNKSSDLTANVKYFCSLMKA